MENLIPSMEDRRGSEPQRIGDILAEWFARYEGPCPAAKIATVQVPVVMEEQRGFGVAAGDAGRLDSFLPCRTTRNHVEKRDDPWRRTGLGFTKKSRQFNPNS